MATTVSPVARKASSLLSELCGSVHSYNGRMLRAVHFAPAQISAPNEHEMHFPWRATREVLNGSHSVHGGALATLVSTFTKAHVVSGSASGAVRTLDFDVNYLAAIAEGAQCVCVSRVAPGSHDDVNQVVLAEFAVKDANSSMVYVCGTHLMQTVA